MELPENDFCIPQSKKTAAEDNETKLLRPGQNSQQKQQQQKHCDDSSIAFSLSIQALAFQMWEETIDIEDDVVCLTTSLSLTMLQNKYMYMILLHAILYYTILYY